MPVIGVLLGLALASKWVAAYAIGALRPADPRPQRARPGRCDPRAASGSPACSATWRSSSRPRGRRRASATDVPADDDRADPRRGRRGRPPPDRLDRRGDAARPRRAGRPRDASCSSAALALGRLDHARSRSAPLSVTPLERGARPRRSARSSSSGCSGSAGGSASVRSPAARPPTTRSACSSRRRPRRRLAAARAGCSGCRSSGRRSAWSCSRSPCTSSPTSRGRSIEHHQLVAGLPAGPHRRRRCSS